MIKSRMIMVVKKIKEEKEVTILKEDVADAQAIDLKGAKDKSFFSSFVEFELQLPSLSRLLGLCFDYMPSSIEILEPDYLDFKAGEAADITNDLLARLHRYDMLVKNLSAENTILKKKLENS